MYSVYSLCALYLPTLAVTFQFLLRLLHSFLAWLELYCPIVVYVSLCGTLRLRGECYYVAHVLSILLLKWCRSSGQKATRHKKEDDKETSKTEYAINNWLNNYYQPHLRI